MLLSFKSWSKSLRSRSRTRRGTSRSNNAARMESLERRDLLSGADILVADSLRSAQLNEFNSVGHAMADTMNAATSLIELAYDPVADRLFGADDNLSQPRVHVFDLATRAEVGSFSTSTVLSEMAFDPVGRLLFGATDLINARGIFIYDTATQSEVGSLAAPNYVSGLAYDPNGNLLFASDGNVPSRIHVYDVERRAEVASYLTSVTISDLAFDPGSRRLFASNYNLSQPRIHVFDVVTSSEIGSFPTSTLVTELAFDERDRLLFGATDAVNFGGVLVTDTDMLAEVSSFGASSYVSGLAVRPGNEPPVGVDDEYTVVAGETLVVPSPGVMGNDYDPDGGTIRSISIRSFPQHSLTSSIGNSGLSYTPAPGFVGDDFWTYRPVDVTDASIRGNLTTVTIHVVAANAPPIADGQSLVIEENTSVTITLSGRDPEGHPVELASFESAQNGSLDTTDDPLTWIYTPNANFVGDDHFTFSISDGTLESATATISIQVNPVTPPPTPIGVDDDQFDDGEQVVQTRAYVANLRSDFVSVIDTATNAVVQQIPVGLGQVGIDVSPDGMRAYATLMDSSDLTADPWGRVGSVAVIDTVAGSVLTTVHTTAPYIADITVSPLGDIVLLTDHFNNVVQVLSTANNSIVASISVGSAPDQLAFSPDGRLAYVSNILSATVSVIDTATLSVVATIGGVGAGANTVCVSPDGSRVYVGSHWNGVSVIDTSSNTVIANLPLNSPNGPVVAMALTPDGTKLYVTDRHHSSQTPNNVWVVNTATNSVETRITVDAGFDGGGLVVSSDGAILYASAATDNTVLAIDTATNQIIMAISVGQVPRAIATGTISIQVVAPTPPSSAAPVLSISGLESDSIATDEDVPTNEILLEVGDADTTADNLTVTVQSSNPELTPEEGIVLSGSGATRSLVLTPAANLYGFATIVVSVSDGEQTTESTFVLTVRPINDVPTATELS